MAIQLSTRAPKSLSLRSTVFVFCIIVTFSIIFSGPIWDTDFWWHLSTGRYIVASKNLLDTDPFSFTNQHISAYREVILNGYWLAQVIFYLCYKLLGPHGIILLRTAILTSIFIFLYLWGKKHQANDFILLFLLILSGWFSRYYTGDRPQLFSFLFAPLIVYLLDNFREESIRTEMPVRSYFLLPLAMVIWANCHRGFIIGTAIIGLYWMTEAVKNTIWRHRADKKYFRRLTLLAFMTITASLINPNTYIPYLELIISQGGMLQQMTSEYVSPFYISQYGVVIWPYWVYITIAISILLLSYRHIDAAHAVITAFLALISLSAFRYIPFFFYVTLPIVAIEASRLIKERHRLKEALNKAGIPVLLIGMAYISVTEYNMTLRQSINHPIVAHRFPVAGAQFIKQRMPKGNIFNNFEWGGYLIWELFPDYKIFIDGRALNSEVFIDAMNMMWDSPQTPALYDKYDVDIVIIPRRDDFTGEFYTVINYLVRDKQWRLVYADNITVVFLRN